MLRQEPGPRVHHADAAERVGLDADARAYRIAVAPGSGQPQRDRASRRMVVAEQPQVRRLTRRHHHEVLIAVAVDVEHREPAAVLIEVQTERAADLVEAATAVVAQQHVALAARDRPPDEPQVDRAPCLVVGRALDARQRRSRDDLSPEEALEVVALARGAREHAVGDIEVVPAVAVDVDGVRGPGPAARRRMRRARRVLERAVAAVPEERIAARVPAVLLAHLGRRVGHERRGPGDALPGGGPHVAGVDVQPTVVVVVEERGAHAGAVIEHAGPCRDVLEPDTSVRLPAEVPVQVLRAEVVGHQQIRPAVLVVVGPRGGEVIPIVAFVDAGLLRDVDEASAAVVAEQHTWRAVACVVVRHRRAGLVLAGAEEVRVDAQVRIEVAVAVVVGHADPGEYALQRPREREGVGHEREAPASIVEEQQRLHARREHEILVAVVVDVDQQRLRRVVEQADARALGDVLERAVPEGAEQAVGQPVRLRDVQVVAAVAVRVADGDAVMAVGITRQHRIEHCAPLVERQRQLLPERGDGAEALRGDLGEQRLRRAARDVRRGDPVGGAPLRSVAPPRDPPRADLLRPGARCRFAHDVVAHVGRHRRVTGRLDRRREELGDEHARSGSRRRRAGGHSRSCRGRAHEPSEFVSEGRGVEIARGGQRRGARDHDRAGALPIAAGRHRTQPCALERRREHVGDRRRGRPPTGGGPCRLAGGGLQPRAYLRQTGLDGLRVAFQRKRVLSRFEVRQIRLQRLRCRERRLERAHGRLLRGRGGDEGRDHRERQGHPARRRG